MHSRNVNVIVIFLEGEADQEQPPNPSSNEVIVQDSVMTPVNGNARLTCQIVGNVQGMRVQWIRMDGRELPVNSYENRGELFIQNVQPMDGGPYGCQALDPNGRVIFTASTILVISTPPRVSLEPQFQIVRPGDDASIVCTATGDQPIQISWSKSGQPYLPRSVYARDGRLDFLRISADDQGRYVCVASNQIGTSEATAEVIVSSESKIGIPMLLTNIFFEMCRVSRQINPPKPES